MIWVCSAVYWYDFNPHQFQGFQFFPLTAWTWFDPCVQYCSLPYTWTPTIWLAILQAGFFALFPLWAWQGRLRLIKTVLLAAQSLALFLLFSILGQFAA
ncbi:MAG: hypothetical protein H6510_12315 [Acidobacteria bacterium]|nr:hypothetical protein [Acidobacteriota bacterium]MCB9398590.1 hypothetical protein [Acidobacteriota bacterium]